MEMNERKGGGVKKRPGGVGVGWVGRSTTSLSHSFRGSPQSGSLLNPRAQSVK